MQLSQKDYERINFGITARTGFRLIILATSPRTYRCGWKRPRSWRACYELVKYDARRNNGIIHYALSDRVFDELTRPREDGFALIGYDTTRRKVMEAIAATRRRLAQSPSYSLRPKKPAVPVLNQVIDDDCFQGIFQLPDDSVSLVVTSPPYADRRPEYEGIREADFPHRMAELMTLIWPKLKEDGSVFLIIRPHQKDGQVASYLIRTILATMDAGWKWTNEMIWLKPDGWPLGAVERPRRNFEWILWFSKIKQPYMNLTACGQPSNRVGMRSSPSRHKINHSNGDMLVDGIARVTDVITAYVGSADDGIDHPSIFPPDLPRRLMLTYAPPGSVILDPFAGSGTTCLVAQSEDYKFIGFDNGESKETKERFAELANRRLKTEAKYARGQAIRDRNGVRFIPKSFGPDEIKKAILAEREHIAKIIEALDAVLAARIRKEE